MLSADLFNQQSDGKVLRHIVIEPVYPEKKCGLRWTIRLNMFQNVFDF